MTPALDRLLAALEAQGAKVTASGSKRMAQCPAHDDHTPSLAVTAGESRVLMHCHAGCDTAAVLAALGLTFADLYNEPRGKYLASYQYRDAAGAVLRTVHRTADKTFPQSGQTKGTSSLYRLPEVVTAVAAGTTIYLVEGEEDVHALEVLGAVATTTPMGADSFRKVDTLPLAGAHVVVVPDQDEKGARYLRDVQEALDGLAASVTVAAPAIGKDAADHVAAGLGLDDLVIEAPVPTLDIVTASDVDLSRVVYVWEHRIPRGAMTLMPGEEGIGKTTVGIRIMADLTRGTLPGEHYGTTRDVLVIATEDGLGDVFVPRLREAGADLTRVHIVKARIALDGSSREVIVPRDLAVLGEAVRRFDAALVWIDSLVTTLPDELKSISYKDTAKVLRALGAWAEAERVAVAAPWHLNKASGSDTAVRIMDSRAFRTAIRSMLLIVADPEAPEDGPPQGLVALDKANAGTLAVPALRYRIRAAHYVVAEVDEDTGEVRDVAGSCGVVDWIGQAEGDGRQLARSYLAPRIEREDDPAAWLRDYLTEHGETLRADVIKAAKSDGGYSPEQMKRAARRLPVHSRDVTGQDPKTGHPFRRAMWSVSQSVRQSVATHTSAPTDPTGEGSHTPTDLISAGHVQSGQSGQSGMGRPTGEEAHPLGDDLGSCALCSAPTIRYGPHGHPLCDECQAAKSIELVAALGAT